MPFQTVITAYLALGTALSANNAVTEQTGSGYARIATPVLYDPSTGLVELPQGMTFLASGSWSASTYAALFDTSSGGNNLLTWQIPSFTLASGATKHFKPHDLDIQLNAPLPVGLSIPAGTVLGQVRNLSGNVLAANVVNPTPLTYSSTALAPTMSLATVVLTDGATINTDCSQGNAFAVTLGGNRMLANPANMVPGQRYRWFIKQDATGNRTLALGNAFKTAGGAPTPTATAGATDVLEAYYDGTNLWGTYSKAFA